MKKDFTPKKLRLLCLFFLLPTYAFANHVLPVFSGYWFTNADYKGSNSCLQSIYSYKNKIKGDAQEVGKALLSNVPQHSYCKWGDPKKIREYPEALPDDFVGSADDWAIVSKKAMSPHIQVWERICLDKEGTQNDVKQVEISPSYRCPARSGYGLYDKGNKLGCEIPIPACEGDIVGRDLEFPIVGKIGHVGLMMPGTSPDGGLEMEVLEVLNKKPVVQLNTLNSFENKTKYWGDRYGLKNKPDLSEDDGDSIVMAGYFQTQCKTTYSLDWKVKPCNKANGDATFRCDAFVYYAYLKGIDVKIFKDSDLKLPRFMFYDKFLDWRDNPNGSSALRVRENNQGTTSQVMTSAYEQEKEITKIFSGKTLDLEKADPATYHFMKDKYISNNEKADFVWKLALMHQKNWVKFSYLVDILSTIKPLVLVDKMLMVLKKEKSAKSKISLISNLTDIVDNEKATTQKVAVRNYLKDMLFQETDSEVLSFVIVDYSALSSSRDAYNNIHQSLRRLDLSSSVKKKISNSVPFINLNVYLILADQELQISELPELLTKIPQMKKVMKANYNEALIETLKAMNPDKISNQIKATLSSYLLKIKPVLNPNRFITFKDFIYYHWLCAFATIKTSNNKEKKFFIKNTILNTKNPEYQSMLLTFSDEAMKKSFTKKELLSLREHIQSQYKTPNQLYQLQRKKGLASSNSRALRLRNFYIKRGIGALNQLEN